MAALNALIVGCGNIAGCFDADRGLDKPPLTHAGAYTRDGRFRLTACVEPDEERREAFMHRWNVQHGFRSIDEAQGLFGRVDVVSICSPTAHHAHDIEASLRLVPKLIFCEKPVTRSAHETERLVKRCAEQGVPMAVNYTRRWDSAVTDLRRAIEDRRWGQLRSVVGFYNKGLLNNGSHLLDLLIVLLGPLKVLHAGRPVLDYSPEDPSVPAWLEAVDGLQVHLACGHAADFALFELQLVFARAVVVMEDGGLSWRERTVAASETFPGYRVLDGGNRREGTYAWAMLGSVDNIFGAISQGAALASTGETALATQRLCEEIRRP